MPESSLREFVALDLETTGLRAEFDRVVEIGAVRFDPSGRELGRFEQLVDPERPMPTAAWRVHGISDEDLRGAPKAREVLPDFLAFLGAPERTTLLAHNASFDAGFLACELGRIEWARPGLAFTDTLALARRRLPHLPNHRLDTVARVLNLDPDGPHRALADSLRVKGLWLALGGEQSPPGVSFAYPVQVVYRSAPAPLGWEVMADAIATGRRVRMEYAGGTRGLAPRDVSPKRFVVRGGVSYLVAQCHVDEFEKEFRLDRVVRFEVLA
jgi:DNA polymerase III epsilon subunit family exonuclease